MKKEQKIATAEFMRFEVPCVKNGKPSYKWVNGYIVENVYPPVKLNEAKELAKSMGFDKLRIKG